MEKNGVHLDMQAQSAAVLSGENASFVSEQNDQTASSW